jgi:tetratricopeptide (TPR) repeat protein
MLLRISILLAVTGLLSACAGWTPPPAESGREVETQVREPARQESAGVQVFPLQNPAVKSLLAEADAAEAAGDYAQAMVLLERALRIQPGDPEILQQMAELQMQTRDYEQALNFAMRSYDAGPRVGELCSRNWRTISVSRERLGDANGSQLAAQRAGDCINTKPQSY